MRSSSPNYLATRIEIFLSRFNVYFVTLSLVTMQRVDCSPASLYVQVSCNAGAATNVIHQFYYSSTINLHLSQTQISIALHGNQEFLQN